MTYFLKTSLIFCLFIRNLAPAQSLGLSVNPTLRENNNAEIKKCISLLERYFSSDETIKFWNPSDTLKINYPDNDFIFFEQNATTGDQHYYSPTLLSIVHKDKGQVLATISFSKNITQKHSIINGIMKVPLIKINDQFKISYPLFFNLRDKKWRKVKLHNVTFYLSDLVKADETQMASLEKFNNKVASMFQVSSISFQYVCATTFVEIQKIRGITFDADAIDGIDGVALSDPQNRIIYVSNGRQDYFHEVIHLYYYDNYTSKGNYISFWDEGLATYLGGSMGKELDWHLLQIKNSKEYKTYNFSDLNKLSTIDSLKLTNMSYVIAALICKEIDQKLGRKGISAILASDQDIYKTICATLGIGQNEVEHFIRNKIDKL